MQERIILAPGCNGSELLKSLADHGINCLNLRVMGSYELAHTALMRSGITVEQEFVSRNEEYAIISKAAKNEAYFGDMTYSDTVQLASAIRTARLQVSSNDEIATITTVLEHGVFEEKNEAIVHVYQAYMAELKKNNQIDSVMLIKKAIQECNSLDIEVLTMVEVFPLSCAEMLLASKISGKGLKNTSLYDLFGVEKKPQVRIQNYYACFGSPNEVENILSVIYKGLTLDKCTVAVTNPAVYSQFFFDYSLLHNIPMTFGTGIPIGNSNPAKLLKMYFQWMTGDMFDGASLVNIINNSVFDKSKLVDSLPKPEGFELKDFMETLGNLRLSNQQTENKKILEGFEKAVNEEEEIMQQQGTKALADVLRKKSLIPALKTLSNEITAPCEVFVTRYAKIRRKTETFAQNLLMKLDYAASSKIYDELSAVRASGIEQADEDIIKNLLKTSVCSSHSQSGSLHITTIGGALVSLRENLFVAGLAASMFPGAPKENYLLLDEDLIKFGDASTYLLSGYKVQQKKITLTGLIRLVSVLGGNIYISYPANDVSELKKNNASSSVFEIYQLEVGENVSVQDLEKKIVRVEYFEPRITLNNSIGSEYLSGNTIQQIEKQETDGTYSADLDKAYSPSVLNTFYNCPKAFVLSYILRIPEPESYFSKKVASSADIGTMAHTMMEISGENPEMSKEEFLSMACDMFDRFLLEHPPLITNSVDSERDDFLELMDTAYGMETHREVFMKEEDIECVHECGLRIHGFPDRVEKLEDGTYCVVDFKTGKEVEHVENDPSTCFQALIYAYILEKTKGIKVSRCEFRYLRLGETVPCVYDDDSKKQLNDMLNYFMYQLKHGFPDMLNLIELAKKRATGEDVEEDSEADAEDELNTEFCEDTSEIDDFTDEDVDDDVVKRDPCIWCGYKEICGLFGAKGGI